LTLKLSRYEQCTVIAFCEQRLNADQYMMTRYNEANRKGFV